MGVSLPQDTRSAPVVSQQQQQQSRKRSSANGDVGHLEEQSLNGAHSSPSTIPATSVAFTSQAQPQQRMIVGAVVEMLKTCAHQGDLYNNIQLANAQDPVLNPTSAPLVSLSWYLRRILHYLERWHRNATMALPSSQRSNNSNTHVDVDTNGDEPDAPYSLPGSNVLLTALVYINRVGKSGRLVLTSRNVHRVLLVAMMLAHRYLEDSPADCQWFAQVGGVSKAELKRLETLFVSAIEWRMFVSAEQADAVRSDITTKVAAACVHRRASIHATATNVNASALGMLAACSVDNSSGVHKRTRVCA